MPGADIIILRSDCGAVISPKGPILRIVIQLLNISLWLVCTWKIRRKRCQYSWVCCWPIGYVNEYPAMHYYGNSSTNCIVEMLVTWGIPSCLLVFSTSLNSKTFNATTTGSLSVLSCTCMLNISIILWNIFSYHSYGKQYLDEGHLSHFALSYIFWYPTSRKVS